MNDLYDKTILNVGGLIILAPVKPIVATAFIAGVAVACGAYYLGGKATEKGEELKTKAEKRFEEAKKNITAKTEELKSEVSRKAEELINNIEEAANV